MVFNGKGEGRDESSLTEYKGRTVEHLLPVKGSLEHYRALGGY